MCLCSQALNVKKKKKKSLLSLRILPVRFNFTELQARPTEVNKLEAKTFIQFDTNRP